MASVWKVAAHLRKKQNGGTDAMPKCYYPFVNKYESKIKLFSRLQKSGLPIIILLRPVTRQCHENSVKASIYVVGIYQKFQQKQFAWIRKKFATFLLAMVL